MSLIQLVLDSQIGKIPRQYLNAAQKYAEGVATSTNYNARNQAAREALKIASRVAITAGSGGLVGLITGEPVENVKFAAAAQGVATAAGFAVRYIAAQAKDWKALSINERRVKLILGEVGVLVSYQRGAPLINASQSIFAGVIFFGSAGLLSGHGFRWDVGALYGAAVSLYTSVRGGLLLKRLEQIRAGGSDTRQRMQ